MRASSEISFYSEKLTPPQDITTAELLALINDLNHRDEIDGILVQLPLPAQIDEKQVLLAIDPVKDVDGFHPLNVGTLVTGGSGMVPCTPAGCIEILKRNNIAIAWQEAVVVGRSNIVGKPLAALLTNADATVTLCHNHTRDIAVSCARANILIAAVGRPGFIRPEMVRPGATVIDVGINRITNEAMFEHFFAGDAEREAQFRAREYTPIGGVDPICCKVAGVLTPVPGGVGPLTIAMLMCNTIKAALRHRGQRYGLPN